MQGNDEIMPFFREWRKQPEEGKVVEKHRILEGILEHVDPHGAEGCADIISDYAESLCQSAYLAGFRGACNILLPEKPEKGVQDETE